MAEENTVKSKATELRKIKHHIAWENLEVNKVYHIPPIILARFLVKKMKY